MAKKIVILLLSLNLANPVYAGADPIWAIISVGAGFIAALPVGITAGALTTGLNRKSKEAKDLAIYMRRNHVSLVRDIALGRGPVITDWGASLKLFPVEQAQLERTLEGSREQIYMLASLAGDIESEDAEVFSESFYRLLVQALGQNRVSQIVESRRMRMRMENKI